MFIITVLGKSMYSLGRPLFCDALELRRSVLFIRCSSMRSHSTFPVALECSPQSIPILLFNSQLFEHSFRAGSPHKELTDVDNVEYPGHT